MDTPANIRRLIIYHHTNHRSQQEISNIVHVPKSTVRDIIHRHRETGNVEVHRRDRCGRKKSLTPRSEVLLARSSRKRPHLTARQIQAEVGGASANVSVNTIKRTLLRQGLVTYRPVKAPILNRQRMAARSAWANQHGNMTVEQWSQVVFSDETAIDITTERRTFVRRGRGAAIRLRHARAHRPFVAKVMFWGCVTADGPGPLVAIEGTMKAASYLETLQDAALPFLQQNGLANFLWQHDNAPCHKARIVTEWLAEHQVQVLPWPAFSPDMNPIENIWAILKRKVHHQATTSREQLIQRVLHVWINDEELRDACRIAVGSMPTRLQKLRQARGGYTGY